MALVSESMVVRSALAAACNVAVEGSADTNAQWTLAGNFIIERTAYRFDEGEGYEGIGIWTWDAAAGTYRSWHFDSLGRTSTGTAQIAEDGTWRISGASRSVVSGAQSRGEGTLRFLNKAEKIVEWNTLSESGEIEGYRVRVHSIHCDDPKPR